MERCTDPKASCVRVCVCLCVFLSPFLYLYLPLALSLSLRKGNFLHKGNFPHKGNFLHKGNFNIRETSHIRETSLIRETSHIREISYIRMSVSLPIPQSPRVHLRARPTAVTKQRSIRCVESQTPSKGSHPTKFVSECFFVRSWVNHRPQVKALIQPQQI